MYGNEYVLRDEQGRICAWLVGMTAEDIQQFQKENPNTYINKAVWDEKEGGIR